MDRRAFLSTLALSVVGARYIQAPTKAEAAEEQGAAYGGSAGGYIIEFENGAMFYVAGDTCLMPDMKLVIGEYYKPDVAFLPIGNIFTMDGKDAAYATTWIQPKYAIPYHYHTFPILAQDATKFLEELKKYEAETKTQPIVLEWGVEREIEGIKVTWLCHATVLLESPEGTRILIDPWLADNPDCPEEYRDATALQKIDLILLTHAHSDHTSVPDLVQLVKLYDPVIFVQYDLLSYLQNKVEGRFFFMNKGGHATKEVVSSEGHEVNMPPKMSITFVNAEHSSGI